MAFLPWLSSAVSVGKMKAELSSSLKVGMEKGMVWQQLLRCGITVLLFWISEPFSCSTGVSSSLVLEKSCWCSLCLIHEDLMDPFQSHGIVDVKEQTEGWEAPSFGISQLSFLLLLPSRQAGLTSPTPRCVGTRGRCWTSTGVPTMTRSSPAAPRTALSW